MVFFFFIALCVLSIGTCSKSACVLRRKDKRPHPEKQNSRFFEKAIGLENVKFNSKERIYS
jgi:hypothetical protein